MIVEKEEKEVKWMDDNVSSFDSISNDEFLLLFPNGLFGVFNGDTNSESR
jgi:hypothetical protein